VATSVWFTDDDKAEIKYTWKVSQESGVSD